MTHLDNKVPENGAMQEKDGILLLEGSSDLESSRVLMMRSIVEFEEPSSKDFDNFALRRFLRAREGDIDKASKLFLKYLKWRKTFVPNGTIDESEIQNHINQNKVFVQGVDKQGHPIGVVLGCRHKQTTLDEFKRFTVYSLDKMCDRIPKGYEKFVCIVDLKGWGYANCDIRGYSGALTLLQDCYPERLDKLFLVHVPYVFATAWKLVAPFIDDKTKKKIVFVEEKMVKETLLEDIEESQLPEIYGGQMELVPVQDT